MMRSTVARRCNIGFEVVAEGIGASLGHGRAEVADKDLAHVVGGKSVAAALIGERAGGTLGGREAEVTAFTALVGRQLVLLALVGCTAESALVQAGQDAGVAGGIVCSRQRQVWGRRVRRVSWAALACRA